MESVNKNKVRNDVAILVSYETFGNAMYEARLRYPITDAEVAELKAEFYAN
jgi:hypothetical protein